MHSAPGLSVVRSLRIGTSAALSLFWLRKRQMPWKGRPIHSGSKRRYKAVAVRIATERKKRMLGRAVNACITPLMFACAALIFIAAYLGLGGHEIVAFWIA